MDEIANHDLRFVKLHAPLCVPLRFCGGIDMDIRGSNAGLSNVPPRMPDQFGCENCECVVATETVIVGVSIYQDFEFYDARSTLMVTQFDATFASTGIMTCHKGVSPHMT